jgi:hypothetical protein
VQRLQDYDAALYRAHIELTLANLQATQADWSHLRTAVEAAAAGIARSLDQHRFIVGVFDAIGDATNLLNEAVAYVRMTSFARTSLGSARNGSAGAMSAAALSAGGPVHPVFLAILSNLELIRGVLTRATWPSFSVPEPEQPARSKSRRGNGSNPRYAS